MMGEQQLDLEGNPLMPVPIPGATEEEKSESTEASTDPDKSL